MRGLAGGLVTISKHSPFAYLRADGKRNEGGFPTLFEATSLILDFKE
jgi:hypothetical protein